MCYVCSTGETRMKAMYYSPITLEEELVELSWARYLSEEEKFYIAQELAEAYSGGLLTGRDGESEPDAEEYEVDFAGQCGL